MGSDGGPAEDLLCPAAASLTELTAFRRVGKQGAELAAQVTGEPVGIRRKAGSGILVERYEITGFAVNDDFFDSSGGTGDYRRTTGHSLEIDDAERFIDRRAAENRGVAIKLNGLGLG